jgi:dihydroorotate dehydrogenase electron transfer subunit
MYLEVLGGVSLKNLIYYRGIIEDIITYTEDLKSIILYVDDLPDIIPGQFLMVWLPGVEEIPISPSLYDGSHVRLTIKAVGYTTSKMLELDLGDHLYVRGPYGRGFNIDGVGRPLLVGGGYGSAPIIYLGHHLSSGGIEARYIEGVSSIKYSMFLEEAEELGLDPVLVTEDGSSGIKGLVTDYVSEIIGEYDYVFGCGPEPMLRELLRICVDEGIGCQLSLERLVKCGVGICGSCVLDGSGLLVCVDGPVFSGDTLVKSGFLGGGYG